MARQRTRSSPGPASPVQGKAFWLDRSIGQAACRDLAAWIEGHGGRVRAEVEAGLDCLVLAESRRGTPGRSQAEKAIAKLGTRPLTIYRNDLHTLLWPSRDAALALLRGGPKNQQAWRDAIPPPEAPGRLDLSGADLAGLDLSEFALVRCDLTGARLDGTNLTAAWVADVKGGDFSRVGPHDWLVLGGAEGCTFDGLTLKPGPWPHQPKRSCSFRKTSLRGVNLYYHTWADCTATEADFGEAVLSQWKASDLDAAGAGFGGALLDQAVLKGARLTGASFSGAVLDRADLAGADLRNVDFRGAWLRGACLHEADLRKADLRGANLAEVDLTGATVTGADFTGANLRGAKLGLTGVKSAKGLDAARAAIPVAGTVLKRLVRQLGKSDWDLEFALAVGGGTRHFAFSTFGRCVPLEWQVPSGRTRLEQTSLAGALLDLAAYFPGAMPALDMVKVKVRDASLNKAVEKVACQALCEVFGQAVPGPDGLGKAKKAAREATATTRDALVAELRKGGEAVTAWNARPEAERSAWGDFTGADFSGGSLRRVDFRQTNLMRANLAKADLREAGLFLAKLRRAVLRGADLRKADLAFVSAPEADCEGADLREADFHHAKFRRANLRDADLRGAMLVRATFEGADLRGARLDGASVGQTAYDADTQFPAGFQPDSAWKYIG